MNITEITYPQMPSTVQTNAFLSARRGLGSVAATAGTMMVTATIERRMSFSIHLPQQGQVRCPVDEGGPLLGGLPLKRPAEERPADPDAQGRLRAHGHRCAQLALQELVAGLRAGRPTVSGSDREASQRARHGRHVP